MRGGNPAGEAIPIHVSLLKIASTKPDSENVGTSDKMEFRLGPAIATGVIFPAAIIGFAIAGEVKARSIRPAIMS